MSAGELKSDSTKQPARPRRRWYQFSLRVLLVFVALASVATWWSVNYLECTQKAKQYGSRRVVWLGNSFSMGPYSSQQTAGPDWAAKVNRTNEDLERAYRQAAWFPWLSRGIEDERVSINPPARYRGDYLFVGYSDEEIVWSESTAQH